MPNTGKYQARNASTKQQHVDASNLCRYRPILVYFYNRRAYGQVDGVDMCGYILHGVPSLICTGKGCWDPPNGEPQQHGTNLTHLGRYIPTIFLPSSWSSLFGVPMRFVPAAGLLCLVWHVGLTGLLFKNLI